jgi:ATP-binding cassette subfamily A (ABC1) protein 3
MMTKALSNLGFQLSFNIGFAMAFVASFFVIVYIKEQQTKAKLLQFVSGVNVLLYWFTAFLWDFFIFAIIALLITITIGSFQEEGYSTVEQLGTVYCVLIMFGFAVLPAVYVASFVFDAPASGFTKLIIVFMLPGVAMFTVTYCMQFKIFDLDLLANTMRTIFLVVPHFALSDAFSNIYKVNITMNECQSYCRWKKVCDDELCKLKSECCGE